MTQTQRRFRRTVPIAGLVAAMGAALLVAQPASAATNVQVSFSDIAPNENVYAGWHQGAAGGESNYAVTSDGLSLKGKAQVIKGYANNSQTFDVKNAVLPSVLEDASYDVTEGDVFFQIPVFYTTGNSSAVKFTTLLPVLPGHPGENDLGDDDLKWRPSSNVNAQIQSNGSYSIDQILGQFDDYKTLAFGVFTGAGDTGSVDSIEWQGNEYTFGPVAEPTPVTVDEQDLKGVENAQTNASWHQGYNNATYNFQVGDDGVNLVGKSQLIKGYESADTDFSVKNADIAFAIRDASFTVANGLTTFQLPIRYDNGSGPQFTTLYSQTVSTGTYEPKLSDVWNTSRAITNSPYTSNASNNFSAPLKDLLRAVGSQNKVKTVGFGFQADSGATISSLTWDGSTYSFKAEDRDNTPATVENADIAGSETADTYFQWHQGFPVKPSDANQLFPSLNHQVTSKGLELTGNSQVVKGFNDPSIDLLRALRTASYTVESGQAELQIPVFFAPGNTFATLRPGQSVSAGTHTVDLNDDWISSKSFGSIVANVPTPLYKIGNALAAAGNVRVIGVSAQHYGAGTAVVSNITFDGTSYSFKPTATTESSTVHENDIATSEAGNYDQWHQGYDDATENQQVTADGLKLIGTSQVIKGYANNSTVLDQKNVDLAQAVRNARFSVESGNATFQIPIYARVRGADNVAVNGFTTLRPVASSGEGTNELRLADTWTVSRSVGSVLVKDTEYSLAEIISKLVDYKVLGFGVQHDGDDPATVSSIDWDGTTYSFGPNRAPVADDADGTVKANGDGGTNSVDVPLTATDADGNDLSYAVSGTPEHGTATIAGSTLTFEPEAGFTGSTTVDFTVSDGRGGSDTGTVTISVTNTAPVAVDKTGTVKANKVGGTNSVDVTLAGTDSDEDTLTYTVDGASVEHGDVDLDGATLTYTPDELFTGEETISYTVSDGVSSDEGTVTISVTNAAPVAVDSTDEVKANKTGTTNSVEVTLAATDADDTTLTYSVGQGEHGLVVADGNTFTYQPDGGFKGEETISYTVSDGVSSDEGTVTITVFNVAPVTVAKTASLKANRKPNDARSVTVPLSVVDLDDTDLTYVVTAQPNGTATITNGSLTYRPNVGFAGTSVVTYTVSDGVDTTTGSVTVSVIKQASKVKITSLTPTYRKTTSTIVVKANVKIFGSNAAAGQKVNVYDLGKLLGQGTVATDGNVTYTVAKKLVAGTHRITVTVPSTATVASNSASIRFKVVQD